MRKLGLLIIPFLLCISCFKEKEISGTGSVRYEMQGEHLYYDNQEIITHREDHNNSWHIRCIKPGPSFEFNSEIYISVIFGDNDPKDFIGKPLPTHSEVNDPGLPSIKMEISHVFNKDSEDMYTRYMDALAMYFKITDVSGDRISAIFEGELGIPEGDCNPGENPAHTVLDGHVDNVLISK